ncbi:hypothetical protein [Solwaraspora sp. WMMD792]|uniref:hypothetical protein n=1 Tax=Solwaraspora sp. WMMD792 TaxID=3016099 RepID=UPI002417B846|nr:hypothetical protein [Solwaraspora sp. WMMD792]MDG4772130.1 hypothetical protein [Solwaraspora sp. WMMD792]
MSRRITRKRALAGLAAAGVLSVGIAAPTIAFAQEGAEPSASASADGSTGEERRAAKMTDLAEALAAELGVSADDVTAALEKVHDERAGDRPERGERPEGTADRQAALQERLDAAVADGKLTQAEADAVLKAYEEGVLAGPGRGGGPGRGSPMGGTDEEPDAAQSPDGT